ncbi:MAG TPA: hypothetical protein VE129_08530 [Thermoanaerobaculia bacterium]|nr:hypothetical protein [Thermoanaerobaculia bacterium]
MPLWNPLYSSGQPFAANPGHEVFHPLTALFLLLPFEAAFRAQFLVPPLVGGLSAFLLARTLRRSLAASALAGVGWAFGGYLLSTVNLLPILHAACVVPAVLTFVIRCGRSSSPRDVAGLAVSVGLVGLAGEPSTILALPLLVGAAILHARPWTRTRNVLRRGTLAQAAGIVLGAGIAAAVLVPGLHHASKTVRSQGLSAEVAGAWSLPPVRILELLSPHVLGHVEESDEAWYWGRGVYTRQKYPFLYSLYPGLGISVAALVGTLLGWRKLWPWLGAGFVGLLLALGVNGPLWGLVRGLPLLSGVRSPERFAVVFCLCLLVVAAHGIDWILGRRARRLTALALGSALVIGLVLWGLVIAADRLSERPWTALGISPQIESRFASVAAADALRVGFVALGGLLVLVAIRKGRRLGALALACWTAADLSTAGRALVTSVPVEKVAGLPPFLAPLVQRPGSGPLVHLAADQLARTPSLRLARPPIPVQWGLPLALEDDYEMTFLRWSVRGRELFWQAVRRRPAVLPALLQRRGVGAVLMLRPGVQIANGKIEAPPGATFPVELAISANPGYLAFAVSRVVPVAADAAWVDAVLGLGDEIPSAACVERAEAQQLPERPSPAEVAVVERQPGRLLLDVQARGPSPSFLAVNQTWDAGWAAFVDGVPTRLLRVDVALSGLSVPPGRHRVSLVYSDPLVATGIAIALAALVIVLVLLLSPRLPWLPRGEPLGPEAEQLQQRRSLASRNRPSQARDRCEPRKRSTPTAEPRAAGP